MATTLAAAPRVVVSCTVPSTAWTLMAGQLRRLGEAGFDVDLLSSPGLLLTATGEREGVRTIAVPIQREIRLRADLRSLARLVRVLRDLRPGITLSGTPKAGLLVGVAAFLTRVPYRVYLLRGLRLETASGLPRRLMWCTEWLSARLAHDVVVVSPSLLTEARRLRLVGQRAVVLGSGSSNGVDVERFGPSADRRAAGRAVRAAAGVPEDAFVFGYVGRLTGDKGVTELHEAFARLVRSRPDVWLLVVGGLEGSIDLLAAFDSTERVRATGWLGDPAGAYHALDVLVLPTYREGFPNVCLEAAAAGLPVVTTTATGAVDAVVDGETGWLVPPHDAAALEVAMRAAADDPQTAAARGACGRARVMERFRTEDVTARLVGFLTDGGRRHGVAAPVARASATNRPSSGV